MHPLTATILMAGASVLVAVIKLVPSPGLFGAKELLDIQSRVIRLEEKQTQMHASVAELKTQAGELQRGLVEMTALLRRQFEV